MRPNKWRSVSAVVLAGGRNSVERASATGSDLRAMTPFRGRPMVDYVIESLRSVDTFDTITVVGDMSARHGTTVVRDNGGFVENLYAGLESATSESVLIVTSDIPFLTAESVKGFLTRAFQVQADVLYPIVPVQRCYARFPGLKRTSVRLQEGDFTGGNVALVRKTFIESQRARISEAYSLRKKPIRLAMMLGIGVTLKLVASIALKKPLLSIPSIEAVASRLIGGTARAVIVDYAELATDLDRDEDFEAAASV